MSIIDDLLKNISTGASAVLTNVQQGAKDITLQAKAEGVSSLMYTVTGYKPNIVYSNNKAYIAFRKEDIPAIQQKLNNVMKVRKPTGDKEINIAFEPVVYPVMIKKVLPFALAAVALGFIAGKVL